MEVTGETLIQLGFNPGKWFSEAITHANAHQLSGDALVKYLKSVEPEYISLLDEARPFHMNLRAEEEGEIDNVEKVRATMDALMRIPTTIEGAVMPDACPTGGLGQIPVGGVVSTKNAIHPNMHSADICCSVMMTNFGHTDPKTVLDTVHALTHFGPGGRKDPFALEVELENKLRSNRFTNNERALNFSKSHLGTQGDGNHFTFVGRSAQTGETIMVTHHGSRGLGAAVFTKGMKTAEEFRREISPETPKHNAWIPYDTDEGKEYWEALQWVREWTKLNHTVLHEATARSLNHDPSLRFWNEHNFIFKEDDVFYHAKGATPLDDKFVPDSHEQLRLIPLNMREPVLIVKGNTTANNMGFAPHGAGRNISRSEHRRRNSDRTPEEIFATETKGLDVRFYHDEIDITELPTAYKNAATVKAQMTEFGLGTVVDEILPYGCIMAGNWQKNAPCKRKNRRR
ncbi:RtcB family protein [Phaeocystidibacter marisrubri]|uniref:3'-phosphate/5'-hydroxy nucleic acid ligase n=1 Tax=Phaeocystidibacter marisrubri TaxID=1577780 RepID=A0A6L3ZFM4_9FLAO|nr:RtcB family protein [Phaeocystidibacter marisrubri]KAB2816308.1 RtcB family protein [Phaeocystidibacter marisrubri]GGH68379.1 RNA-splicing ligase RtcB [Phaeocystidibacter marisrubri]